MSAELTALVGCVVVGVFAPVIGTFLVQKRLSLIGDGIGHVAFAGVGAGLLLGVWPVWTALLFAVVGAVGVELLRARRKASGDLALALFFYAGLALGAVFASNAGDVEIETLPFLFGDPLTITPGGLATIVAVAIAVVAVVVVGGRVLFAIVSDEDWSRVQGLPVDRMNVLLAGLAAAVVVAGMRVVGLLLVAALLVMPVASAQLLARSFRSTMVLASAVGGSCAALGLGLGLLLDVEPGGMIVLLASGVFAATALITRRAPRTLQQEEHA
ncbi:MAG TPA: metal ABC transporter permease [Actinomycetota bacterium]